MLVSNVSVKAPVALLTVPVATVPAPETHAVSVVPACTRLMEEMPEADAPVMDQLPVTSSADAVEPSRTLPATRTPHSILFIGRTLPNGRSRGPGGCELTAPRHASHERAAPLRCTHSNREH